MPEHVLWGLAVITVLGVGAQWVAWRTRAPAIVLLLVAGFAAGNATDLVDPDAIFGELLFPLVSLSVAIILFEGGLSLRYQEFRRWGGPVFRLVILGTLVTWAIGGLAAWTILGFAFDHAILLGAILVVTGPTVVVPILRQIRATGAVASVLKWEGIVIDPVGAMLTVLVFEGILAGEITQATTTALFVVLKTLVVGGAVGGAAAAALWVMMRRYWIPDFLHNPVVLMMVVFAFAVADMLQEESGLFATPLIGLLLANRRGLSVRHIVEFQENVRVLLLAGVFIVLGARVGVAELQLLGWQSFLFLGILLLVARPAAVAVSTWRTSLEWRERVFLGSMAPRGIVAAAVSSIFAIRLQELGRETAVPIDVVIFFVIVGTVVVYGVAANPLAKRLRVTASDQGVLFLGAYAWVRKIAQALHSEGQQVLLVDTNRENIRLARMEGLRALHADALSESVFERLDVEGMGRLLAMTSNDELNSLAVVHFSPVFERSEVYQLPPQDAKARTARSSGRGHIQGRFLFDESLTFEQLTVRFAAGAQVRTTPITSHFTFERFRETYGRSAVPLFLISETGELVIYTISEKPAPRPGQILVSLVEPRFAAHAEEARKERRRTLWRRLRASSG